MRDLVGQDELEALLRLLQPARTHDQVVEGVVIVAAPEIDVVEPLVGKKLVPKLEICGHGRAIPSLVGLPTPNWA